MKRNSLMLVILMAYFWLSNPISLQAQTLQVTLSPDRSKVDRNAKEGKATIIFDSNIEDLSIVCTDENPNEPIERVTDNLWYIRIDVKKDIDSDEICYRNFLLKSSSSAEYYLTTEPISPKQVLYYTITLPNELEPKLLIEKSRSLAERASALVNVGDSYLARKISLEALNYSYTIEAEIALRHACQYNNAVLKGHSYAVSSINFSPDDKHLVSTGWDISTYVWDVYSGYGIKIKEETGTHASGESCYSPDGRYILTVGFQAKVFDAQTLQLLTVLDIDDILLKSAAYSHDGKRIYVSTNKKIIIFDALTFRMLSSIDVCNEKLTKNSFSPDGKRLCCFKMSDSEASIVEICSGKKILSISETDINAMSFSPNGKLVATASWNGTIKLWDSQSGIIKKSITVSNDVVSDVIFSPDGRLIASASWDGIVRLWDAYSGRLLKNLQGHDNRVLSLSFSSDGRLLASSSWDNSIRIWDLAGEQPSISEKEPSYEKKVYQSPDGEKEVIVKWGEPVKIINKKTGELLFQLPEDTWQVHSVDFSPDNKTFVTSSQDYTARIWDATNGNELKIFKHNSIVYSAVFSPDGKKVATGTDIKERLIKIWNIQNGKIEKTIHSPFTIYALSYSPDGNYLACLLGNGIKELRIYDAQKWTPILDYEIPTSVHDKSKVVFEKSCIKVYSDQYIYSWDFPPLQELVDKTRERFKDLPFTPEEKAKYNLE